MHHTFCRAGLGALVALAASGCAEKMDEEADLRVDEISSAEVVVGEPQTLPGAGELFPELSLRCLKRVESCGTRMSPRKGRGSFDFCLSARKPGACGRTQHKPSAQRTSRKQLLVPAHCLWSCRWDAWSWSKRAAHEWRPEKAAECSVPPCQRARQTAEVELMRLRRL